MRKSLFLSKIIHWLGTLNNKLNNISTKEFIGGILPILSLLISVYSITQSSAALEIQKQTLIINVQVIAQEQEDAYVTFVPFPDGDNEPFPATYGFINLPIEVRINNLSLRKVSITDIDATPILEYPESKKMTPFFTNGQVITTNFSMPLKSISSDGEIKIIDLPFILDEGESIALVGNIGWPVSKAISEIITKELKPIDEPISLLDLKNMLAFHNITLSRARIELLTDENGTPSPIPISIDCSKLIYRFDVFTSFDTRHKTYLDLDPGLYETQTDWNLLMGDEEEEIDAVLGR